MISSKLRHVRLSLLFLVLSLFVAASVVLAQSNPAVMRGDDLSITVGELVEVPVLIENAYEVYAIDVQMHFDPALIEVIDANANNTGVQILPGSFPVPEFVGQNNVVNTDGTIRYLITQINPTPPASGSGTVFTILLRAKANGDSLLRFDLVEMSSRDGILLDVTTQDVTLSATGGTAGTTPGAPLVVPTIQAIGGGDNTEAATATTVPPTASPVNGGSTPTTAPAVGSPIIRSTVTVESSLLKAPATAVSATIAPKTSGGDAQAPVAQELKATSIGEATGTGAVAAVESGPGTVMPEIANGAAPIAVDEEVPQANEEAAAPAVIGSGDGISEAISAETAAPNAAVTENVPSGNHRAAPFLMLALLILAACSIGLIFLLMRNRSSSPR